MYIIKSNGFKKYITLINNIMSIELLFIINLNLIYFQNYQFYYQIIIFNLFQVSVKNFFKHING